jgi:toxin ParE1/3/4
VSLPYVVRQQAEDEITDAVVHYERQRAGLGTEFFAAIRDAMRRATEAPDACSPVRGAGTLPIRFVIVRRFPYRVVFLREPDLILFLAVAHADRRPGYWRDRI